MHITTYLFYFATKQCNCRFSRLCGQSKIYTPMQTYEYIQIEFHQSVIDSEPHPIDTILMCETFTLTANIHLRTSVTPLFFAMRH